jgi:hypothetical protein
VRSFNTTKEEWSLARQRYKTIKIVHCNMQSLTYVLTLRQESSLSGNSQRHHTQCSCPGFANPHPPKAPLPHASSNSPAGNHPRSLPSSGRPSSPQLSKLQLPELYKHSSPSHLQTPITRPPHLHRPLHPLQPPSTSTTLLLQ